MRELDVVLQRYLDTHYLQASERERRAFEALLEQQDPELLGFLMGRAQPSDPDQAHVVVRLSHTGA
jgi:antitoxin CptB